MLLGIDFGFKNIGLAVADNNFISPLKVIGNSSKVMFTIVEICKKLKIGKIIVGLPDGEIVPAVKNFARELRIASRLPVIFQDESLTTQDALAKMILIGKRQKPRRQKDAVAAALILENFIERQKHV